MSVTFSTDEDFAVKLDSEDPLRAFRDKLISHSAKMANAGSSIKILNRDLVGEHLTCLPS